MQQVSYVHPAVLRQKSATIRNEHDTGRVVFTGDYPYVTATIEMESNAPIYNFFSCVFYEHYLAEMDLVRKANPRHRRYIFG